MSLYGDMEASYLEELIIKKKNWPGTVCIVGMNQEYLTYSYRTYINAYIHTYIHTYNIGIRLAGSGSVIKNGETVNVPPWAGRGTLVCMYACMYVCMY